MNDWEKYKDKRFKLLSGERIHTGEIFYDGKTHSFEDVVDLLNEQDSMITTLKGGYDEYEEIIGELKQRIDSLTADDDEFIEAKHINKIYEKLGFMGVIEYAKCQLSRYGVVREEEPGLWVLVTGGWSDHEHWIHCLNSIISVFCMKHYCAYERGGAFYYTEEPHGKIKVVLKDD